MPFIVFFPASTLPPASDSLIFTALSPYEGETGIPISNDIIIGAHVEPLIDALAIKLNTVDLTVDGAPAMTNGVPQDGYSVSTHIGIFNGHLGYIFIINPDTDVPSNTTLLVTAFGQSFGLDFSNKEYTFDTSAQTAFRAYHQFGTLTGRYRLLTTPLTSVQQIGDYIAVTGNQFLSFADFVTASQQGTLVHTTESVEALSQFSEQELADLIEANQIHLDEALGNPTPSPTTMFGPTFASTVLSPHNKQIGPIKLQPQSQPSDGYFLTTELEIALVNFAASFGDFEDAVDMANADAAGVYPLPVSYWSFDNSDLVGTTALDLVSGYNGAITGATTGDAGIIGTGQSFDFSAGTDLVDAGNHTEFEAFNNAGLTASAWINGRTFNASGSRIFDCTNAGTPGWIMAVNSNGGGELIVQIFYDGTTADYRYQVISTNTDYHVAMVWNAASGVVKLYVDGSEVTPTSATPGAGGVSDDTGTNNLIIGNDDTLVRNWDGNLDELAIWNQELTDEQIFEVYSRGATNQKLIS